MRFSYSDRALIARANRRLGIPARDALPGGTITEPPPPSGGELATLPREAMDVTLPTTVSTTWNISGGDNTALLNALANAGSQDKIVLEAGGIWVLNQPAVRGPRTWSLGQYAQLVPSNLDALQAAHPLQADGMPTELARSAESTNPRITPNRAAALGLPIIRTNSSLTTLRLLPFMRGLYCRGIDFQLATTWTQYNYGIFGPDMNDFAGQTDINCLPAYVVLNQCLVRSPVGLRCTKAAAMNIEHHAVVNSYVESHHVEAEHTALWCGWGRGVIRWENNAVLGTGINVFVGGVHFSTSHFMNGHFPRDGVIKDNLIMCLPQWIVGNPAFSLADAEPHKNLLEFKSGGYWLIENNDLVGSSQNGQNGQGITIKVLNEGYDGPYTKPGPMIWSETHDLTIRYNRQRLTGTGWDIIGNQQTANGPYAGQVCEGYQVNRLLAEHNLTMVTNAGEGYFGPHGRFGLQQAYLSTDELRGRRVPSWTFRHNTWITRTTETYGVGFYMGGQWDTGWPRHENSIFGQVPFRHFTADSMGSTAQALATRCPGTVLQGNVFGKLNAGDNDFDNSFGTFSPGNHFLAGDAAIGIDRFTGELAPTSPCRAGGAQQALDNTDNGCDWPGLMARLAGKGLYL